MHRKALNVLPMFTPVLIKIPYFWSEQTLHIMATIATVLRKDKINKKGLAPIHFRITRHRKSRYISSSIYIDPKYWNSKKEIAKPSHPNSTQINNHLAKKFSDLQAEILNLETTTKAITTPKLKEKILGGTPTEFIPFAEKSLEPYLSNGQIGTYDKNRSICIY